MPNILEMHILQSFSTNCLNRDDTNSVKTVDIGGAKRTRISSQCLKRASRVQMHEDGIKTGIRSRGFAERITAMISAERGDETPAETLECASEVVKALGGGDKLNTLLFL
ncbi:MAG: type I-E CRISPR-associated protein Cas7/Cse4/CasC, partial [Sutterella sp.]